MRLFNGSAGTSQLIADIAGYTRAGDTTGPGTTAPVPPARILDTRTGNGAPKAVVKPGQALEVKVRGKGNIPDSDDIGGVFLNLTITHPTKPGYITAYPDPSARPTASNLNFVAGQTIPNMVFVPINTQGEITLYNGSTGTLDLLADTAGFVRQDSTPPPVITTSSLPDALAGAPYQVSLAATGGTEPYTWAATGLPSGLTLDSDTATITGNPASTGTTSLTAIVTDAQGNTASKQLDLNVPSAVPDQCRDQACAVLTPAAKTTQLTTDQLASITRDSNQAIKTVTTTGVTVHAGDTLVLPAGDIAPSGAVSKVTNTATGAGGQTISTVTPSTPGSAFTSGTVITDPNAADARTTVNGRVVPRGQSIKTTGDVKCDGSATASVEVTLTPQLRGTVIATWDFWKGLTGGFVGIDGSIAVGFDASMEAQILHGDIAQGRRHYPGRRRRRSDHHRHAVGEGRGNSHYRGPGLGETELQCELLLVPQRLLTHQVLLDAGGPAQTLPR